MIPIDKRKFLAELGRLLTFMYEEDRQTALSMYEDIFVSTDDQDGLLKLLGSPTKQAVLIARAYNAKERDLAIHSQTGRGGADVNLSETPDFIKRIGELALQAEALGSSAHESGVKDYETVWKVSNSAKPENAPEASDTPREDNTASDSVVNEKAETDDTIPEKTPSEIDNAIATFTSEPSPEQEIPAQDSAPVREKRKNPKKTAEPKKITEDEPVGEISIPLLILYIIIAVPLTALGVLILLVPAILCLSISLLLASVAIQAISTAFGGFAVFADIMVVLGCSLVIIALAILFLWIFIWFIGGAIVGLINASIRLGGKFCTVRGDR